MRASYENHDGEYEGEQCDACSYMSGFEYVAHDVLLALSDERDLKLATGSWEHLQRSDLGL